MNSKGFVFTGMAFLLVVPTIILVASFANMLETGDLGITTALRSDSVFFTYINVRKNFEETSENLVAVYGNNTTAIRTELNSTWAPFIEQNYSVEVGLNISIPEEDINVTYDNTTDSILIGNISNINVGIPITVVDEKNITLTNELGPLVLPIPPGNLRPTVNITYPPESDFNLTCTSSPETFVINGTANDADGSLSSVYVSTDGVNYNTTNGTYNWNYSWTVQFDGTYDICTVSVDDEDADSLLLCRENITVSGCGTACSIVLGGSTPITWGGQDDRVRFDVLNINASDITVDNMTVSWNRTDAYLDWINIDRSTKEWDSGAGNNVGNNTPVDITNYTISATSTADVELRFAANQGSDSPGQDMEGTSFNVTFDLTNGELCSVSFSVYD